MWRRSLASFEAVLSRRVAVSLAALLAVSACGGGDSGTDPDPNPPTPTVSVTLGTSSGAITQGGTLDVPVTVVRGGGFTGAVVITAAGVSGVTAGGATIPAGSTSGTLTLTADAAATPGSGTLTVTAAASTGTPTSSTSLALTVNVRGTYTLSGEPASLPLVQGNSGNVGITVNRAGGFAGTVSLTATAPAGLTATLTPSSVSNPATTSTLQVSASSSITPGSYSITVTGTTPGLANQTSTVTVVVSAPGSYTLGLTPATLTLAQGAAGTSTVGITRLNNFTAAVALAATAPAGITASVSPSSVTGNSATLSVTVGASVAPGNYTVTVTGTATGLTNQVATLSLQVTAAGGFTIAATPATLSVQQGASGGVSVALTRTGNFAGDVALTATTPAGVTVTFNPATLTTATSSSTMTVTVAAGAAVGTGTITVKANSAGMPEQTATVSLTVTAAPVGDIGIALSPSSLTVVQGASGTATVTLTRTGGYTGNVTLTATTPAGVTVSFNPATLSGATLTSQMTVNVAAGTATGSSQITVRANGTGVSEKTATLSLTVNQSGGTGNISWQFCGVTEIPVWVAVQDGNGGWTRITGNANNQYSFQVSSAYGAIAYVTGSATTSWDTNVFYFTTAELQAQGGASCGTTTGLGKTVTGSATGVTGMFDAGYITLGNANAQVSSAQSNFTLENVMDGPVDLIASRVVGTIGTSGISYTPNSLIIQRNLNPLNNSSLGVLDFNSGIAPASAPITFSNAGADNVSLIGMYYTPRNTTGLLFSQFGAGVTTWYGVPSGSRQAGELHLLYAMAQDATGTKMRQTMFATANVAALTFSFGPDLSLPTVSVLGTSPYVRLRMDFTLQSDYNKMIVAGFYQDDATYDRNVAILASAGYLALRGTTRLEIPDFSGVSGWNNDWGIRSGLMVTWSLMGMGWAGDGITAPVYTEGALWRSAMRAGEITP